MRSVAAAMLAASTLLLVGCAATPPPAPLTLDEVEAIIDERNQTWWNAMFPDEPMPVVEPIELITGFSPEKWELQTQCITDAQLPGVSVQAVGEAVQMSTDSSDEGWSEDAFLRTQFVCSLSYPFDPAQAMSYLYSDEQIEYLDTYFRSTLAPCLRANGFSLSAPIPSREDMLAAAPDLIWSPYVFLTPMPETMEAWALIDLRCPPPAVSVTDGRFSREDRGF